MKCVSDNDNDGLVKIETSVCISEGWDTGTFSLFSMFRAVINVRNLYFMGFVRMSKRPYSSPNIIIYNYINI